jgi:hypothetical protein
MTDGAAPELILYGRPGCGLCDDTRESLAVAIEERRAAGRRVPSVVERDISRDPLLSEELGHRIPAVELGGRRLELVTSVGRLRRLMTEVLG